MIKEAKIFKVFKYKESGTKSKNSTSHVNSKDPDSKSHFSNLFSEHSNEIYSLKDLFELDEKTLESKMFQLVVPLAVEGKTIFKYVQIQRREINNFFSKNTFLQIVDISQKVMLNFAVGEKRLISVINATVSHEMRNPVNAIHI